MERLLRERGYEVRFVFDRDAPHNEVAWGRRFPDAARFLLG
jgi:hypothetical protein